MKTFIPVSLALVALLSLPVSAQINPQPDGVGTPLPVACRNCDCDEVIPTRSQTWGGLKSL